MGKQSVYDKKLDNALDYCIKLINTGATIEECIGLYPNLREELKELLAVAAGVNQAYLDYPKLRPPKLYIKTGRERFLAAIEGGMPAVERELFRPKTSHIPTPFSLRGFLGKYLGVGVAVAMLVAACGGLLYASNGSLPGNPLYGVKRAIEQFELATIFNKEGKDKLRHKLSKRLTDEANLLTRPSGGKTNLPAAQAPFAVSDLSVSGDYIHPGSSVMVSVSGATSYPYDIGLYQGSVKIAVIARKVSESNYSFIWYGTDIDGNPVKGGKYQIRVTSQGQIASAEQKITVAY